MSDQTTEVKRKDLRFIYQLITDAKEELSSGNIGMVGSRIGYLQHAFLAAFEGKLMDEKETSVKYEHDGMAKEFEEHGIVQRVEV